MEAYGTIKMCPNRIKACLHCRHETAPVLEVRHAHPTSNDYRVVCDIGEGGCGSAGGYRSCQQKAIKIFNGE